MADFDPQHLEALNPRRWRIITSLFPADVEPGGDSRTRGWLETHEDSHAHLEVMLCLAGNGCYGLRHRLYPVQPGTLMLFDTHEPHQSGYPEFARSQDHLWFSVVPSHFTARLVRIAHGEGIRETAWTLVCDARDAGVSLARRAFGHAGERGVPDDVRRLRLVATVGAMLAAVRENQLQPRAPANLQEFQARILDTIRRHIETTAGNGVTLADLARIAGYSRFHLHRLFRRHYGRTIQEYIDLCRRHRVRELLEQGWAKKQIAAELGFSCPAAFSRWLREKGLP